MTTLENNRCYACSKLFCCAECCTQHIRKKHPGRESKCPLCRSERLMVKDFDNQEFLCHVVFHHLPLRCRLCGENFKSCEDLRYLGACNLRRLSRVASAIQGEASPLLPDTPSPLNKTPCGSLGAKKKEFSIESSYNGNFENFTSPPEFSRNTSTPMQVNLASNGNFAFKTPRNPNFTLKTPKTASASVNARSYERSGMKENIAQNATSFKDADSPSSDSIYFSLSSISKSAITEYRTPLRSILSNQSVISDNSQREYSRTTEKKRGAMQEINEEMGIDIIGPEDMDLTDARCNIISDECSTGVLCENVSQPQVNEQRDCVKRVRFSDQFEIKSEAEVSFGGELNGSESEEFFEARQSISEFSIADLNKLSTSAALIKRENEKNSEKEGSEDVVLNSPEITELNRQDSAQNSSTISSSSRVVMMVVVEKNGTVDATDLGPLIQSSLKKLESVVNPSAPLPRADQHGNSRATVVSVDSYMSVSTVECYSTPNSTINVPQSPRDSVESSNSGTGGIFSAMAHAMRTAFRNLSGANSSKSELASRELASQKETPALLPSNSDSSAASSNVLTNLASSTVPRPAKRLRDVDECSAAQSSASADLQNDIKSPVPKRHRGWYKIRGREPIARMRNNSVTSPRGISSETQSFQQGLLSIGDTILPIPSRAHQSTQTD